MPRPRKLRLVHSEPGVTYFKPRAVPLKELEEVVISVTEFEALRLADSEQLDQVTCAKRMGVSQPTFNRTIKSAHNKIADAIINGKAIKIEGGEYKTKK